MLSEDQKSVVVFNGEIYNYLELKTELETYGHHFKTNSDTEVVLKSYEQWGYNCLGKFNGMWAIALWDNRKKELFISRDRIGEKPLYYGTYDNSFIFGSEIKSILAYSFPATPNLEMMDIYLSLGYLPAPFSFYKDIHKLHAGQYMLIRKDKVSTHTYWDLPDIDESAMLKNEKQIHNTFESLFSDSVSLRMRSDVPFGALLSGGLDSASIVALMSQLTDVPIETFTIAFEEKDFDESKLARLVAKRFGTKHHEYIVKSDSFEDSLQKIIHHCDEPFGDSSAIPTGYVSRFAREKVKVVLTGDGGDEVLSGYSSYQGEKLAIAYQNLPSFLQNGIPAILKKIAPLLSHKLRCKADRTHRILHTSRLDFQNRLFNKISGNVSRSIIDDLIQADTYACKDYLSDFFHNCPYKDSFYQLMYFNFKVSLPYDMLVKVDRMSMAHSLEARTPFLDHRLIEYMVKVDKRIKMKGYERKSILRQTIGSRLPKELLKAPKRGFVVPIHNWFKEPSFDQHWNLLMSNSIGLHQPCLKRIITDNRNGTNNYGNFLWMLFVLTEWLQTTSS